MTVGKNVSKKDKLKIFGNNLKYLRKHAGLSKKDIATILNILPQQYYRYEDGTSEPGVIMAAKLASVYNVDVQNLFETLDNTELRMFNIIHKLNEYGIKAKPDLSKNIYIEIIDSHPVLLSLDAIDFLIEKTLEDIKPSLQNNFINTLQKNYLLKRNECK